MLDFHNNKLSNQQYCQQMIVQKLMSIKLSKCYKRNGIKKYCNCLVDIFETNDVNKNPTINSKK